MSERAPRIHATVEEAPPGELTMSDIARKGGEATKARYGREHYVTIGKAGGRATKERYGPGHYARIGQIGVQRAAEVMTPEDRRPYAEKAGRRVRELTALGRRLEAEEQGKEPG